jgi:hypothetical protein
MSHIDFEPGKMVIDFSKGFSLVALMKITEQKRTGRKVIFEIGHTTSQFRLTLGLDNEDNLNLWLKDVDNEDFELSRIPKKDFFNKWVVVVVEIEKNNISNKTELSLTTIVDKERIFTVKDNIFANVGSKTSTQFVIGSTLEHEQYAAFTMSNLSIYETTFTEDEIKNVLVNLLNAEEFPHE